MSKVFFIHFRNVDAESRISNFGGTTVAFREVGDGVQYVGTTGKTLKEAIDKVNADETRETQDFSH